MNKDKSASLQEYLDADQYVVAGGRGREAKTAGQKLLRALIQGRSALNAEAILLSGGKFSPWLQFRTLLSRGQLREADAKLGAIARPRLSDIERAEHCLEKSRLLAYAGSWPECEQLATRGLSIGAAPVSVLSLHQVRALARFENGDLRGASHDIERADSLATLFPEASSAFYSTILRVKLLARTGSMAAARAKLDFIWNESRIEEAGGVDRIHAMLRLEIDLRRLERVAHADLALASLALARSLGEQTYIELGWLDCFAAMNLASDHPFARSLGALGGGEPCKARRLWDEIHDSAGGCSSTAQAIRDYRANAPKASPTAYREDLVENCRVVLHPSRKWIVRLADNQASRIDISSQQAQGLIALGGGALGKDEFFKRVWGKQKYAPHLHDNLIWSLIHRLNRVPGLQIGIRDAKIAADRCLIIA